MREDDPVLVRPAHDDELDEAGRVVAQAYRAGGGTPDPYLEVVADARARSRDGEVLVAVDRDGTLLGSVTFALPPSPLAELARADEGEFRMLGVSQGARGRGVGEALVRACVRRSSEAGKTGVVLCTQPWMVAAQRLYAREGFVRDPERDWSPLPGVELLAYRLRFSPAAPG